MRCLLVLEATTSLVTLSKWSSCLTLKFSFASASWHQEQTMNKHTLSKAIPAKTSLQNALSEGNHNGHGHGTAQGEGANTETGINQSCSFSTGPQSFFWHQRETTSEPTKNWDHSLCIWFSTHLWSSLLLQLSGSNPSKMGCLLFSNSFITCS